MGSLMFKGIVSLRFQECSEKDERSTLLCTAQMNRDAYTGGAQVLIKPPYTLLWITCS